jgi:prefoldin subunit 5
MTTFEKLIESLDKAQAHLKKAKEHFDKCEVIIIDIKEKK